MNWYQHQKDLIDQNPNKRLVAFGCGAGKTRTTLQLAKNQGGKVLVVAPKTQVLDRTWERENEVTGINADITVMSKERFKKGGIPAFGVLILDESHCFVGVTSSTRYRNKIEIPRASQLFEETLKWIKEHNPKAIYLCSATPFPQPLALYAVAKLFGEDWDYFAFRRKFYTYVPNIGRGVWIPKKDSTDVLIAMAKVFGTFGRLEDFFDVPDQTHKQLTIDLSAAQKKAIKELPLEYPDPLVRVGKKHQIEQQSTYKADEIISLAREFDKLVVFAKYTDQINLLEEQLKAKLKGWQILVLNGQTPDRGQLLKDAENHRKTVLIAQSQVSTGYELPSYRCTVFASMSYSFVDYEQALGRSQRANNISKNVYVYLLAGDIDRAVLKCVEAKKDFNELLFANE